MAFFKHPLGHYSLAGCSAKTPEQLPEDVAADEKHTSWNGSKAYIATTVGEGCFWQPSAWAQMKQV